MRSLLIRPMQAGFTLVELLIVVIILAILAAVIVPQFSGATRDAQESALDANLATMRSAIEIYRVQHSNVYPGTLTAVPTGTCPGGGTPGTGGAVSGPAFTSQLTMFSNAVGWTCSTTDATYRFGPYLRRIPPDAITPNLTAAQSVAVAIGLPSSVAPDSATGGWIYDNVSGQIAVNNGTLDTRNTRYNTH